MKRFKYAYESFYAILEEDQNLLLHILTTTIVIILGSVLNTDRINWILVTVAIGLVLSSGAINTSIEFVIGLITTDYHEYAKYAKDIAAFSVIIVSVVSICIGLIVFLPYILDIFRGGVQ